MNSVHANFQYQNILPLLFDNHSASLPTSYQSNYLNLTLQP